MNEVSCINLKSETPCECPVQGDCHQEAVIYQANVKHRNIMKTYFGMTKNEFRTRFNGHNCSLNNPKYKTSTELSTHVWKLKDAGIPHKIDWSIKTKGVPYQPGAKLCDLCLVEKTVIALANPETTLNSRSELLFKCKHKAKFCLSNF